VSFAAVAVSSFMVILGTSAVYSIVGLASAAVFPVVTGSFVAILGPGFDMFCLISEFVNVYMYREDSRKH